MQVRAARTRQALILAAAELIDDRGMKGTGLLDISRAAGVSKGALYFHFTSKDELVATVRQEARRQVLALADECLDERGSTLAGAARFTVAVSRRMRDNAVLRAGLRLESEGAVGAAVGGPSLREDWLTLLRARLAADAEAGRLRPEADPEATANLVAAVTVGLESLGRQNENWWEPRVTTGIWRLLLSLTGSDEETAAQVWDTLRELPPGAGPADGSGSADPQGGSGPADGRPRPGAPSAPVDDAAVLRLPAQGGSPDREPVLARACHYDPRH